MNVFGWVELTFSVGPMVIWCDFTNDQVLCKIWNNMRTKRNLSFIDCTHCVVMEWAAINNKNKPLMGRAHTHAHTSLEKRALIALRTIRSFLLNCHVIFWHMQKYHRHHPWLSNSENREKQNSHRCNSTSIALSPAFSLLFFGSKRPITSAIHSFSLWHWKHWLCGEHIEF